MLSRSCRVSLPHTRAFRGLDILSIYIYPVAPFSTYCYHQSALCERHVCTADRLAMCGAAFKLAQAWPWGGEKERALSTAGAHHQSAIYGLGARCKVPSRRTIAESAVATYRLPLDFAELVCVP